MNYFYLVAALCRPIVSQMIGFLSSLMTDKLLLDLPLRASLCRYPAGWSLVTLTVFLSYLLSVLSPKKAAFFGEIVSKEL